MLLYMRFFILFKTFFKKISELSEALLEIIECVASNDHHIVVKDPVYLVVIVFASNAPSLILKKWLNAENAVVLRP